MKILAKLASVAIVMVVGAFLLVGCFEQAATVADGITEALTASQSYYTTNVYSKLAETDFNTTSSADFITDENYYVLVASDIKAPVTQIKLNQILYKSGLDVSLSVGNSNLVTRPAFKFAEEKLYISSQLLFLNAGMDGVVTVSFPAESIQPFMIDVYQNEQNTLNLAVTAENQDILFTIENSNYRFYFKANNPNEGMFVKLYQTETNLTETQTVIVEKVANPGTNIQSSAYTFTTPTTPTGQTENGLLLYPVYNAGVDFTETAPVNHDIIYNIYVPGIGSRTVTLSFQNTFTPAT